MRYLVFNLTLILTVIACTPQRSYHQDVVAYLTLNGTEEQYNSAIDQMFDLLKRQYSMQNIPDSVWDELQQVKKGSLDRIKSKLVPAYQSNFSHQDIKELIIFYESPLAKQMVADPTALTDSQKEELSTFFNSPIGEKVANQSESLKTMVSEVSESWSRDLYNQTIDRLKDKGYTMQ